MKSGNVYSVVPVQFATVTGALMSKLNFAGYIPGATNPAPSENDQSILAGLDGCAERRHALRKRLKDLDGIDAEDVIMTPDRARSRGLTATVCFPVGNPAPEGSVIKSPETKPKSRTFARGCTT